MTVKKLIEQLKTCNPEALVYLSDWNEGYAPAHLLIKEDIRYDSEDNTRVVLGD